MAVREVTREQIQSHGTNLAMMRCMSRFQTDSDGDSNSAHRQRLSAFADVANSELVTGELATCYA
jgi:hypothetical protein